WWSSEVPVLLAVFHRRGRDPVVGASGTALGHSGGGNLGEDGLEVIGARFDGPGAAHIPDGAVANLRGRDGLAVARGGEFAGGPPHAVALEDFAFVGEVELGQVDAFAGDVAPHVEFGEVRDREHADVFAGQVAAIEEVPQFGALAAGVPTAEFVAQGQNPLLRAGLVLVAAGAAGDGGGPPARDGLEQRLGLAGVPGGGGAVAQAAGV